MSLFNYRIFAQSEKSVSIDIDGIIGNPYSPNPDDKNTSAKIKQFIKDIKDQEVDEIVVNISSPGGLVADGLLIYEALKAHPVKIKTVAYGFVASMATIIHQAGDVRKSSKNSMYCVHNPWALIVGDDEELKKASQELEKVKNILADIYVERGSKSKEEYLSLMKEDKWIDAKEAKSYGLTDEVFTPEAKNIKMIACAGNIYDSYKNLGINIPENSRIEVFNQVNYKSDAVTTYPIYEGNRGWNGNQAIKDMLKKSVDQAKKGCCLYNADGGEESVSTYGFPYIIIDKDSPYIHPRAVAAIGAALAGGRGGINLEKRKYVEPVYNKLKARVDKWRKDNENAHTQININNVGVKKMSILDILNVQRDELIKNGDSEAVEKIDCLIAEEKEKLKSIENLKAENEAFRAEKAKKIVNEFKSSSDDLAEALKNKGVSVENSTKIQESLKAETAEKTFTMEEVKAIVDKFTEVVNNIAKIDDGDIIPVGEGEKGEEKPDTTKW